jgi:hypothetical protein
VVDTLNFANIKKSEDKRRIELPGRVLVAHQADFMPWLGFFSKACMGDLFLLLDDTQFKTKNFQNRNKIRFPNKEGWLWLTIPIEKKNGFQNMLEVKMFGNDWRRRHLKSIEVSYANAPYFAEIFEDISVLFNQPLDLLVELNLLFIKYAFKKFNIEIPFFRVSEIKKQGYDIVGKKNNLILSMCKTVCADVLVLGSGGRDYIDINFFNKYDVKIVFQDFKHPVYNQFHGTFLPFMSFVDILFNEGVENSKRILGKSGYKFL